MLNEKIIKAINTDIPEIRSDLADIVRRLITLEGGLILVSSITISPKTKTLSIGETFQMSNSILPSNASNKMVNWSTSDNSIATINNTGLVTSLKNGSCNIVVSTVDGNETDMCALVVSETRPIPQAEPTMKFIKRYGGYYLRTPWDADKDMIEQFSWNTYPASPTTNGLFNFTQNYLVPKSTADTDVGTATKILLKSSSDDACPVGINNGYVSANHGYNFGVKIVNTSHGKTEADIGSIWVDSKGEKFTIVFIKDVNTIQLIGEDKSTDGTWKFIKTATAPLTHVSGATNQDTITTFTLQAGDLLPVVNNFTTTFKTNGDTPVPTESFKMVECRFLECIETYNIMDINDMIIKLRANVGNNTNISYYDNSVKATISVANKYHFRPNKSCTIHTKYDIKNNIFLETNPAGTGYFGFIQSQQMPKPASNTLNMYIPDIEPIGSVEYNTTIAKNVSGLPLVKLANCINNKVANRITQYYTDGSNIKYNGFGHTVGYNTDTLLGRHSIRKDNVDRVFNAGEKAYICGISAGSTNYYNSVLNGEVLEMNSYRLCENYNDNPQFTSCGYYYVGNNIYYNIDVHSVFDGKVPVIGSMYGMDISVVESSGNVSLNDSFVKEAGISITTSGNHAYIILKLTPQ